MTTHPIQLIDLLLKRNNTSATIPITKVILIYKQLHQNISPITIVTMQLIYVDVKHLIV